MASHFYSTNVPGVTAGVDGITKTTVTTVGANFELRVDDGVAGNSKEDVLKGLEALWNFILTDNAPA